MSELSKELHDVSNVASHMSMAATCWTCQDDAEGRHCSTVPQSRLCHFARVESCLCLSTLPSCHAGEQNSGTQQWRLCCMPRSCSYCRGCSLSVIRSKVWGGTDRRYNFSDTRLKPKAACPRAWWFSAFMQAEAWEPCCPSPIDHLGRPDPVK